MDSFTAVMGDRRGPSDGIPSTDDPDTELDRLFELGYRRIRVRDKIWVWVNVPGGSKSWCAEPTKVRVSLSVTAAPEVLVRFGLVDRTDVVERINYPGETDPAPVWLDELRRSERFLVHIEQSRDGRRAVVERYFRATGRWWDRVSLAEDGATVRIEGAVLDDTDASAEARR